MQVQMFIIRNYWTWNSSKRSIAVFVVETIEVYDEDLRNSFVFTIKFEPNFQIWRSGLDHEKQFLSIQKHCLK